MSKINQKSLLKLHDKLKKAGIKSDEILVIADDDLFSDFVRSVSGSGVSQSKAFIQVEDAEYIGVDVWDGSSIKMTAYVFLNLI